MFLDTMAIVSKQSLLHTAFCSRRTTFSLAIAPIGIDKISILDLFDGEWSDIHFMCFYILSTLNFHLFIVRSIHTLLLQRIKVWLVLAVSLASGILSCNTYAIPKLVKLVYFFFCFVIHLKILMQQSCSCSKPLQSY